MASTPREDNRVPGLIAKSDADNTPVIVEADPATKRLKVTSTVSGTIATTTGANTGGSYANISVTTSATLIKTSNSSRASISIVHNTSGSAILYWGFDNSVTTSNGFPLDYHQPATITNTQSIYGISSSGTLDVRYVEEQ